MLLLVSTAFGADVKATQAKELVKPSGTTIFQAQKPDLVVKSVRVTSDPVIFYGGKIVLIPLEITIANLGAATNQDFNVGAAGSALDGNVYGFDFAGPGTETMPERGGILVHGMQSGTRVTAEKSYTGLLLLGPNPINASPQPGTRWRIRAMVDYNLDPDAFAYEWGVNEANETNNEMEIIYPPTPSIATMTQGGMSVIGMLNKT
ncbi:MAG TPA: hypothetical protein PK659_02390 [Methanothrix sp.]|nr:hypothetical protein [Methanothrix sp.]HOK57685.1 hypothetical protein [Methanothrix sp.]HOL43088.1 hypothetical protein [Methanothrix sp.]HPO88090.1 hypothetical protein [Methanothrix sp.]